MSTSVYEQFALVDYLRTCWLSFPIQPEILLVYSLLKHLVFLCILFPVYTSFRLHLVSASNRFVCCHLVNAVYNLL